MMSQTTSLGSTFSAERCGRPVTSSRFIAGAPIFFNQPSAPASRRQEPPSPGDKKSGVDPLSAAPAAPGHRPEAVDEIVSKRGNLRRVWPPPALLCEVVPDHRELVRQLVPQKDHRDDDRDRDNGNDECVFDQALPGFVADESTHSRSLQAG